MGKLKTGSRYLLTVGLVGAAVLHFTRPEVYLKIMPPYLPLHLELVYLSGFFEIALGGLLQVPRVSHLAAWGIVLLLIAIVPANIYLYQHQDLVPAPTILHLLRLPLQGVLMLWAYWYTK